MRIRRIAAYQVDLPLHEGSYRWSGGKAVTVFDSTIVRVETDAGLVGHGEVCPLGPFYSYVTVSTADGAPRRRNGRMAASTAPGLGVSPKLDVLGQPKVEIS